MKNINLTHNIVIITHPSNLGYENLELIIHIQTSKHLSIGLITGQNRHQAIYMAYKNCLEPLSLKDYLNIAPLKSSKNNSNHFYFKENIDKEVLIKEYTYMYLFGGGRIDQISLGKNLILRGDKKTNSNRESVLLNDLNTNLLCVNGCVAGVVKPSYFESNKNRLLSSDIFDSNIRNLIAPISTKLSNEYEGKLLEELMVNSNFSIGEICLHLNSYCCHCNMPPKYILYGDPSLIYGSGHDNIEYNNNYGENSYFSSEYTANYYNIGKTSFFFPYTQYMINNIKEENISEIKESINTHNNVLKRYISLKKIRKMIAPKCNDYIEIFQENMSSLEKLLVDMGSNTYIDGRIKKILSHNEYLINTLDSTTLTYWFKNIEKDKIRIYDLHYGNYNIEEYRNLKVKCPVCKSYYLDTSLSKSYISNFCRRVMLCPSCSIINDTYDSSIDITNIEVNKKADNLLVKFYIVNNDTTSFSILGSIAIRGRNSNDSNFFQVDLPLKEQVVKEVKLDISQLNVEDNKIYLCFIFIHSGKLYYFKRLV